MGLFRSNGPSWLLAGLCASAIAVANLTGGDVADYTYLVAIVVAIAGTVVGLMRNQTPANRRPWLAIVAAELCFFLALLLPNDVTDGDETAALASDLAQIAGYLLIASALTALIRQRRADRDDPARADALVVVLVSALLSWIVIVEPMLWQPGGSHLLDVLDGIKPAFDVVAVVASIQLVAASRRRTPGLWMLGLALAGVFSCDLYRALFASGHSAFVGALNDALVLIGFFGIAAASLHPSIRRVSRPQAVALRRLGAGRTVWLAAVLMLPVATMAIWIPESPPAGYVRLGLSLLLTLVVIGRLVRTTDARFEREQSASRRAAHDDLTGLPNRARFYEELGLAAAEPERQFALLMIDLNDFKQVNDVHGHQAGDAVLVAFGDLLHQSTREADISARLGGDEFAVLLNVATTEEAVTVAERIVRTAAARQVPVGDRTTAISCSIGIAMTEPVAAGRVEMTELMHRADQAMYAAKRMRTSGWQFYAGALTDAVRARPDHAWLPDEH
ncbi:GGDEF domain-containing protein [Catenuloplanes japonicus]|uniref:GGDEF domain-containing protein n=1 Tax=Catenuloplanes japonicus TaxID=33876 RepID=UPI000525837E|nr:GGDEF domain-containing protein [Catenuloplanes japonicus]